MSENNRITPNSLVRSDPETIVTTENLVVLGREKRRTLAYIAEVPRLCFPGLPFPTTLRSMHTRH